jgi:hypothetical protein
MIMLYSAPDTMQLALSDAVLGDGLKVEDGQIWDRLNHSHYTP